MAFPIYLLNRQATASPQSTDTTKPIPKIGPIELPLFVVLVFFGPFFLGLFCWIFYLYTFKRCADRKHKKKHPEKTEEEKAYDVEMQLRELNGKKGERKFESKEINTAM